MSSQKNDLNFHFDRESITMKTSEFIQDGSYRLLYFIIIIITVVFTSGIVASHFWKVANVVNSDGVLASKTPLTITSSLKEFTIGDIYKSDGQYVDAGELILASKDYVSLVDQNLISGAFNIVDARGTGLTSSCDEACLLDIHTQLSIIYSKVKSNIIKNEIKLIKMKLISYKEDQSLGSSILVQLSKLKNLVRKSFVSESYLARESGNLRFSSKIAKGAFVSEGEKLFEVIPNNQNLYLKIYVMDKDVTSLKKDMEVQIELEAYPAREYGVVKGVVDLISIAKSRDSGKEDMYEVSVTLKDQFIRKGDSKLRLLIGMNAEAHIITGYISFFEKYSRKIIGD